jgi:hypothetical protein
LDPLKANFENQENHIFRFHKRYSSEISTLHISIKFHLQRNHLQRDAFKRKFRVNN